MTKKIKILEQSTLLCCFFLSIILLFGSAKSPYTLGSLENNDLIIGNSTENIKLTARGDIVLSTSMLLSIIAQDSFVNEGMVNSYQSNVFNVVSSSAIASAATSRISGNGALSLDGGIIVAGTLPAARQGDAYSTACVPRVISKGSPTVLIQNLPAARQGDIGSTGGVITQGNPTILINNLPAARVNDLATDPSFINNIPCVGGPILPPGATTVLF